MFSSDPAKTASRVRDLQRYLDRNVMHSGCEDAAGFVCPSHAECSKVANGTGVDFAAGQMSHVGEHYDLSEDGYPLRVMVVGQEVGTDQRYIDLAARRQQVLTQSGRASRYSKADGELRNPHMRGTTSALRALLGRTDTRHEAEFLDLQSGERVHMFDAFALVNVLLCSAYGTDKSKQGRSSAAMRRNCERHFQQTLQILDPSVIVVQGLDTWHWIEHLFDAGDELAPGVSKHLLHDRAVIVARFTHPSVPDRRQWGRGDDPPYLRETVVPVLRRARSELRDERGRLEAMLRFTGKFDLPGSAGHWSGGETIAPNTVSMRHFVLSDAAAEFEQACYEHGWVIGHDDWLPWAQDAEQRAEAPARFEQLDAEALARCLTVYIRRDRFSEGTLAHCFETGAIAAILGRMQVLAAELA